MKKILLILAVVLIIGGAYFLLRPTTPVVTHPAAGSPASGAGAGEHCGGNMATAKACQAGYHCAPETGSHLPFGDVGGVCIAD